MQIVREITACNRARTAHSNHPKDSLRCVYIKIQSRWNYLFVHHPRNPGHLVDDAIADAVEKFVRQPRPASRHEINRAHGAQRHDHRIGEAIRPFTAYGLHSPTMRARLAAMGGKSTVGVIAFLAVALAVPVPGRAGPSAAFDTVIERGRIVDGTGSPWFQADIGIRGARIAAIGALGGQPARLRIDAHGLVVAPGFIDMLGQSEVTLLVNPHVPSKLFQGITTEITGELDTVAPLDNEIRPSYARTIARYGVKPDWSDFAGYFARLERQGTAINVASFVSATRLREMVVGYADRRARKSELTRMRALVAQAMRDGAVGLSSALEYATGPDADTAELIALASEAARFGGIYATHMRSYQEGIMEALEVTFRIAREAAIPVEIWHLEVAVPCCPQKISYVRTGMRK